MKQLFEVKDIHISYGKKEVVKGVTFSMEEGEMCALLGLNGSGKTTLMRGICGLLSMQGSATVRTENLDQLDVKKRAKYLSFIPQVSSSIYGKTVLEVILMGANPYVGLFENLGKKYTSHALEILKKFQMESFAQKEYEKLSQGQKQLIILARTLVQNTPVMIMDEPDSALDFLNRHMILEQIREVVKNQRKAGLLTLHDPNFAMAYCDRLLLLKEGALIAEIDMRNAKQEEIERKLSMVYENIRLISYETGFFMVKEN